MPKVIPALVLKTNIPAVAVPVRPNVMADDKDTLGISSPLSEAVMSNAAELTGLFVPIPTLPWAKVFTTIADSSKIKV
jgi:hypothetical protein